MNFTPTIGLSQYTADDETNWMGPVNADNLKIDQAFAERDQKTSQDDLKIETIQTNLTNLTTQVDHDTAEIDKLIAGANDTTKDITDIEARLTAEEDATAHMQQDISNLLSTQGEHSTDIENLTTRTDNLDTLTQQLSGDYTTLNNDVKQLDSEVSNLKTNDETQDQMLENIETRVNNLATSGCVLAFINTDATVHVIINAVDTDYISISVLGFNSGNNELIISGGSIVAAIGVDPTKYTIDFASPNHDVYIWRVGTIGASPGAATTTATQITLTLDGGDLKTGPLENGYYFFSFEQVIKVVNKNA